MHFSNDQVSVMIRTGYFCQGTCCLDTCVIRIHYPSINVLLSVSYQEYIFPDVRDRQFLIRFYKLAHKKRLNVDQYNRLRNAISQAEEDLRRLRDPLQLHLPIKEIQKRASEKE